MSSNDEESATQEIVIIRRRSGEEEGGHHGGVWKIAYADFMTAMMAFFLVMWLINATDKKVITQVATYFNPLRLTDKAPTPKGVHDSTPGAPGQAGTAGESKQKAKDAKAGSAVPSSSEEALFKDPYGALEKIAEQANSSGPKEQARVGGGAQRQAQGTVAGGEAFRDPFEPDFRRSPAGEVTEAGRSNGAKPAVEAAGETHSEKGGESRQDVGGAPVVARAVDGNVVDPVDAQAKPQPEAGERIEKPVADNSDKAATDRLAKQAADRVELERVEGEIRQSLNQLGLGAIPDVDVKITDEGLLISLTDKFDFGMFAIASAQPRPAMVVVMERIANVLAARTGQIIVRGHTDGRPFRSATYDNWRLSTARAQMAYYMLVRGGVDEKRFERIEGHADRSLRVSQDPGAAQNRRIELLLRLPKP